MDLVNDSLSQVPFNQSADQYTYLHIDTSDRQLAEVREFKQNIQQALSHAWNEDRELAETRFLALRRLVEQLSSQDPEQKRWRKSVLDVRQHVEFIGRELDEEGLEVEIYRSGAAKSGGQRQKLATTCLAAASCAISWEAMTWAFRCMPLWCWMRPLTKQITNLPHWR
jgi:uncharacterized protein YPO0396